MSSKNIFTPGPWNYGVRKDGSIWMSLGDPTKPGSEHEQFDFDGSEKNARLMIAAPRLLEALIATQFGFNHSRCPVCAGWNVGPNGETDNAHTQDCGVARAISEATGGKIS